MGPKGKVIPERIIAKPPSAELRPDQKDEDSLPPYAVLDAILKGLIERDLGAEELAAEGHDLGHREPRLAPARGRRVQAPPGAARREDHLAPDQQGAALSDRQRLSRVGDHADRADLRHAHQAAGRASVQAHRHRGFSRARGGACQARSIRGPTSCSPPATWWIAASPRNTPCCAVCWRRWRCRST